MGVRFIRDWSEALVLGTQMIEKCIEGSYELRRATATIGRENRTKEMIEIAGDPNYKEKAKTIDKVLELSNQDKNKIKELIKNIRNLI